MILVTGGAGYIGSHVTKGLHKGGVETVVIDDLSQGHEVMCKWGRLIRADFGDEELLKRIFGENKIEAVMHFAARSSVPESLRIPDQFYENNTSKTITLLKVMKDFGVRRLIFSSSAAVYGNPEYIPLDEQHPTKPITPYGNTKRMMETIASDFDRVYGIRFVAFRYFNACGADGDSEIGEWHEPEGHLIPLILDTALGRRSHVEVFGLDYETRDGTGIRDYIHVEDLVEAHLLGLKRLMDGGSSLVCNLGNGEGFSVGEVIEMAKRVSRKDVKVVYTKRRLGDPAVLVAKSDMARRELRWKPKKSDLRGIIESAFRWQQILNKKYKR